MPDISYIGTTVAVVAATPATFDAAGYAALTWTATVGGLVEWSTIGDESEDITWVELSDGRSKHVNGAKDGGSREFTYNYIKTDPGQIILRANSNNQTNVSIRITDSDGDVAYATGRIANVMDKQRTAGEYKGQTGQIRINSSTVRV